MRYLVLVTLGVLGCGSDPVDGADASLDASLTDAPATKDQSVTDAKADAPVDAGVDATPDAGADGATDAGVDADASADGGSPPDGGCASANDCRLFASYCSLKPCQCLPLNKNDPDPVCGGQTVQCFVAPCLAKTAVCSDAGTCAVGP